MPADSTIKDHQTWLGYLQPDGLVVSPAALVDAQVFLDRDVAPRQLRLREFVREIERQDSSAWVIANLREFLTGFLEWPDELVAGSPDNPIPDVLKIPLREFGETLEPTYAFHSPEIEWFILVSELPPGTDLDVAVESAMSGWSASHTRRFERLLRETTVPIGLISNGEQLRLVYAPRGENAGTLTFKIAEMVEVAGRPILSAFEMLLTRYRMLGAPPDATLTALLKKSRDYQSRVSAELSGQVLDALYELLRGFQAAHERTGAPGSRGELLREVLARNPDNIYGGLLTVLMRLVFLLYAEDRGLMPGSDLYVRNYAVRSLFERLRADAEQYPDTMDHRYGAWPQLVSLFRALFEGCDHPLLNLPARAGHLFDPERFPFLEGRSEASRRLPLVSDGVIHRVLEKLIMLDGERLSYRTLDVEQIGSVYETMMGFQLRVADGLTIALKPSKPHGAPVPINLEVLLASKDRAKWIAEHTDYKLPANMSTAVKAAKNTEDLLAALERRIARNATPQPVAEGGLLLHPTDERRKSGSHYTPRSLTEPIVRTTLQPILDQLGENHGPDEILNLKICDPAMGSGAFLVEACRQLADELVKAWARHGYRPSIPPDEDEILFARRIIAQRCLYGVDKNPMAVDLAKLSLWLATLAKDHPFTFLDHSLRCGDSLVGLTREQIAAFHWAPSTSQTFIEAAIRTKIENATRTRRQILTAGDDMFPEVKAHKLATCNEELKSARLIGDAVIAAFFAGDSTRTREENRVRLLNHLERGATTEIESAVAESRNDDRLVVPFHWQIEFPEVFTGKTAGFDAIIGNPPFLGGKRISTVCGDGYKSFLLAIQDATSGNADLVARFFRKAFELIRQDGNLGLIATNTIAQGDTRRSGLRWIRKNGGIIFSCTKRYPWPGAVAVVVSIIHIARGTYSGALMLNGKPVEHISAFLFHVAGDDDPTPLAANEGLSFIGCDIKGQGFLFADDDPEATPVSEWHRLAAVNETNREIVMPYMSGEEINESPIHAPNRWVINFGGRGLEECKAWPELLEIVETKVRPERIAKSKELANWPWWQFWRSREQLATAVSGKELVLALSRINSWVSIALVPTGIIYSEAVVLFPLNGMTHFGVLQSQVHERWARFLSSTALELIRYAPSDCFETFPFPRDFESNPALEAVGKEYYEFRAALMVRNNEGLTKTYNRFHDPGESSPDILRLRELHAAMDRAVLDAYGWTDIHPTCDFLLDYEDEEEDAGAPVHGAPSRRRKPWRYRWPDELRDEVLARLLKLNAERAEEERLEASEDEKMGLEKSKKLTRKSSRSAIDLPLFDHANEPK